MLPCIFDELFLELCAKCDIQVYQSSAMAESTIVFFAAIFDAVFTLLTYLLYIYKHRTSLAYVNDVFQKAKFSEQRQQIEKVVVVFIETLTFASHCAFVSILLVEDNNFFPFIIEDAIFLGAVVSLNIGMILWPVFINEKLSPEYPEFTDAIELISAIGSVLLAVSTVFFKSDGYTEYIYYPIFFLTAKFFFYDF